MAIQSFEQWRAQQAKEKKKKGADYQSALDKIYNQGAADFYDNLPAASKAINGMNVPVRTQPSVAYKMPSIENWDGTATPTYKSYEPDYSGYENFDIAGAQARRADIAQQYQQNIEARQGEPTSNNPRSSTFGDAKVDNPYIGGRTRGFTADPARVDLIQEDIALRDEIWKATRAQTLRKYGAYEQASDFKELSASAAQTNEYMPGDIRASKGYGIGQSVGVINPSVYGKYEYMTPGETSIFNYTLAKYGKEEAKKYLDALEYNLTARARSFNEQATTEFTDASPVLASAGSVLSNLGAGAGGVYALAKSALGQEVDPNSAMFGASRSATGTRGAVADKIESPFWKFIYQTGMSVADNALMIWGLGLPEPIILGLMGTSSATSTMTQAFDSGATQDQAVGLGLMAGVAEVLFEKISLDRIFKIKSGQEFVTLVRNILVQSGVEASEEIATEIANIFSDALVMGDKSQMEQKKAAYMQQGMTEAQASAKAYGDLLVQVGLAGAGGFLSGGFLGGVGGAAGNYQFGQDLKNDGAAPGLVETGASLPANTRAYQLARQMSVQQQDGSVTPRGNLSGGQLTRLYNANIKGLNAETMSNIETRLKGAQNETYLARTFKSIIEGKGITDTQADVIARNDTAKTVFTELTGADAATLDAGTIKRIASQRGYNAQLGATTDNTKNAPTPSTQPVSGRSGAITTPVTNKSAGAVAPASAEFASVGENAAINMPYGTAVSLASVDFGERAPLYEAAATLGNTAAANALVSGFKGGNMDNYVKGFRSMYLGGKMGLSVAETVKRSAYSQFLSEAQRAAAYEAGSNIRTAAEVRQRQANVENRARSVEAQKQQGKSNMREQTQGEYKPGVNRDYSDQQLSADQRVQLRVLDEIFKAEGKKIVVHDSISRDKSGKPVFNTGNSIGNAYYDAAADTYHLALNSVAQAYAFITVHESVHEIATKNREGYDVLETITMAALEGNLMRNGASEAEAKAEIRRMAEHQADLNGWYTEKNGERVYSDKQIALAREEVVANTVPVILTDEQQARRFADRVMKASADVRNWFQRLINKLLEVLNKAYKQLAQDKSWQQMELVRKDRDAIQMIADAYFEGMQGTKGEAAAERGAFSMKDVEKSALERFGTTYLWNETGYITTDGKQLDFSGKNDGGPGGYRALDHRDISDAFDDASGKVGSIEGTDAMIQFMAAGNIRIMPESGGINLSVTPTSAQREKLQSFVRRFNGEVIVDFDDTNGDTLHGVEYPAGTGAVRVTNDIKRYFEEGIKPEVSDVQKYRFSLRESDGTIVKNANLTGLLKELDAPPQYREWGRDIYGMHITAVGNAEAIKRDGLTARSSYQGYDRPEAVYMFLEGLEDIDGSNVPVLLGDVNEFAVFTVKIPRAQIGKFALDGLYYVNFGEISAVQYLDNIPPEWIVHEEVMQRTDAPTARFSLKDVTSTDTSVMQAVQPLYADADPILQRSFAGVKVDAVKVNMLARAILKRHNSTLDLKVFADDLAQVISYMATPDVIWSEARDVGVGLMKNVLAQSPAFDAATYKAQAPVRDYLRTTGIAFDEGQKAEAAAYAGSWNDYRRALFGKVLLANDGRETLDGAWQTLVSMGAADSSIKEGDMPRELYRLAQTAYAKNYANEYGYDEDGLAYDMLLQASWQYLDAVGKDTLKARRKLQEIRLTERKQYQERYAALRDEKDAKVREAKAQYRERLVEYKRQQNDRRRTSFLRGSIEDNAKELRKWLTTPNLKEGRYVPEMLRGPLVEFLGAIDFTGPMGGKTKQQGWAASIDILRNEYNRYAQSRANTGEYAELRTADDFTDVLNGLADDVKKNRKYAVSQLDAMQLEELDYIVKNLKAAVRNVNRMFKNKRYATAVNAGDALIAYAAGTQEYKLWARGPQAFRDFLNVDMLDSYSFFDQFGEAGESIIKELDEGMQKSYSRVREAAAAFGAMLEKRGMNPKDVLKLTREVRTFKLESGRSITLTTAQVMDVYNLSKRPQGLMHLLGMGIEISNIEIPGSPAIKQLGAFKLTEGDISTLAKSLTKDQAGLADDMMSFLSTTAAAWGNEVSREQYGTENYRERTYWPIRVAAFELETKDPAQARAMNAVANSSFTKATTKYANNTAKVVDVFQAFSDHIAQMSIYNGLALPIDDVMKWMNYKQRDEKGNIVPNANTKLSLERVAGQKALPYLVNLIKDLNGLSSSSYSTELPSKLLSNFKKASVAGKLRVVIQQPTAVARALYMIDGKYMLAATFKKHSIKEMQEYAPIAWWKAQGNYEIGVGRSLRSVIISDDTDLQRLTSAAMAPAGKADDISWAHIWEAVKLEINDQQPTLEGDAFFEAVANRFSDIVNRTQVVDTVLHRSQAMRSKDLAVGQFTAFMSEPTKSYNMMRSALIHVLRGGGGDAKRKLVRAIVAWLLAQTLNAAVLAVHDAIRDREESDKLGGLILAQFKEEMLDNINPLGMIPFVKEIVSLIQGYDSKNMTTAAFANAWNAITGTSKQIAGTSKKTWYNTISTDVKAVSYLLGLPVGGIMSSLETIVNAVMPGALPDNKPTVKSSAEAMYFAFTKNDARKRDEAINEISNLYLEKVDEYKAEGLALEEARKKARSSVLGTCTDVLKPLYLAAKTAKEKRDIMSLAYRIRIGTEQLYNGYDFANNWK